MNSTRICNSEYSMKQWRKCSDIFVKEVKSVFWTVQIYPTQLANTLWRRWLRRYRCISIIIRIAQYALAFMDRDEN